MLRFYFEKLYSGAIYMNKIAICSFFLLICMCTQQIVFAQSNTLLINELCQSNLDQWIDPSFNYGDWAEIYNPTDHNVDISDWYVSDNIETMTLYAIHSQTIVPAHGFATIWFDHYDWYYSPTNIDLKLDYDGGTLILCNEFGEVQCQVNYPKAISRSSWARTIDGGNTWNYNANPSPGTTNQTGIFSNKRLDAPTVDCESKIFSSGEIVMNVSIPSGCVLRYTTDGSTPTFTNGETSITGTFRSSETVLYRLRLFCDDYIPSKVVTRSFIKNEHYIDLPIVSISGTKDNFFGDSLGIFTKGVNGRYAHLSEEKCNYYMDWDRPCSFELFSNDGKSLFSQEVDVERAGAATRQFEPWTFKVKGNKKYEGEKNLEFQFFEEKNRLKHKALIFRNGGNDISGHVIDAFSQQIIATSGINIDYQSFQPVAHFINGVWKGVINMREPSNKHFVYANYGWDSEEIDQFEMSPDSGYVQKCGTKEAWLQLYNLSKTASSSSSYDKINQLLDLDEFCNYMAIQFYLAIIDWPNNNVKGWRPRIENGKFRFVLHDLDTVDDTSSPFTKFEKKQYVKFNYTDGPIMKPGTLEVEMVSIFLNLLKNTDFKKKFIDSYSLVAGSVFEEERCRELLLTMSKNLYQTQQEYENCTPWESTYFLISVFTKYRQNNMMKVMKNYSKLGLTNSTAQTAKIESNIPGARLFFNNNPIPTNKFNGLFHSPVTVKAEVPGGYKFTGWYKITTKTDSLIASNTNWKYYDQGSLDGYNWQLPTFNDEDWTVGKAPLGYNDSNGNRMRTTLDYGSDKNNRRPTYYFRTNFQITEDIDSSKHFYLRAHIDDGFVIYLNGQEVYRYNVHEGDVSFNDYTLTYSNNDPDTPIYTLNNEYLKKGDNLLAVEVHNYTKDSETLYWNAELFSVSDIQRTLVSTNNSYKLPTSGSVNIEACFESYSEESESKPVIINEISADNSIYINDYMKKADWIELYNNSSSDIDLSGMYLSDNLEKPKKYKISKGKNNTSTIIKAHGYKVIWCDKSSSDKDLHASFKLDNIDGGKVLLSAADDSWRDTLIYCHHESQESVGRYPDGSNNVYIMNQTTLEKSNRFSSYCYEYEQIANPDLYEYDLSINSEMWATLCLPYSFDIPNEMIIYSVTGIDEDNTLHLELESETEANKPYLVFGNPGTYHFSGEVVKGNENSPHYLKNGLLQGTYSKKYVPKGAYVLQNHNSHVGFYRVSSENYIEIDACHAYLNIDTSTKELLTIPNISNGTIITVEDNSKAQIFDIWGKPIDKPTNGFYIIYQNNGKFKKVMIK